MLEDVGEISEILGRSYGCPDGVEEEDLDAELACLEDEMATGTYYAFIECGLVSFLLTSKVLYDT